MHEALPLDGSSSDENIFLLSNPLAPLLSHPTPIQATVACTLRLTNVGGDLHDELPFQETDFLHEQDST
jgi:hypothetical protein